MTHLLALLALPCMVGDLDAEGAIQLARTFAEKLQFDQKLTVTGVRFSGVNDEPPAWRIGFACEGEGKGHVAVNVSSDGKVTYFSADSGVERVFPPGIAQEPEVTAQARELLARVSDGRPVDNTPVIGTGEHQVLATFYVLKNGLRFYSMNPSHAYLIGFDPGGKENRWFAPPPPMPSVASAVPSVAKAAAVDMAARAAQPASEKVVNPEQVEGIKGDAKLGYYLVPKEEVARLVWVVELAIDRNLGGTHVSGFWRTVYVDAHAGSVFYVEDDASTVVMLNQGQVLP
jgi:hypothetical protein